MLAFIFVGCSSRAPVTTKPAQPLAVTLGLVEVSDGVTTRQDIGDGLVCIIKPSVLKQGLVHYVRIHFTIVETHSSGDKIVAELGGVFDPDISGILSSRATSTNRAVSIHFMPHIKQ
jgi:hypothetical protein